jgi:hypothetical protein
MVLKESQQNLLRLPPFFPWNIIWKSIFRTNQSALLWFFTQNIYCCFDSFLQLKRQHIWLYFLVQLEIEPALKKVMNMLIRCERKLLAAIGLLGSATILPQRPLILDGTYQNLSLAIWGKIVKQYSLLPQIIFYLSDDCHWDFLLV